MPETYDAYVRIFHSARERLGALCAILTDHTAAPEDCLFGTNLIWPEDRAWCLATDCDSDSALVGGSRALIDAILAAPELEAREVDGAVALGCDADAPNPVAAPPPGFGEPQDPVELARCFTAGMLEFLGGKIVAASAANGVLELEVEPEHGGGWRLEAPNSDSSPADPAALISRTIERVELEGDTNSLRCSLSDGSRLVITPCEPGDGDRPSWRVELPEGIALKHVNQRPWLFTDLPDEG